MHSIYFTVLEAHTTHFNPIALSQAKIVYSFGLTECSRVKDLTFHS